MSINYYLCGMNENTTIFHGSNVSVEAPKILVSGYYKDFGYGFYCTNLEKQAHVFCTPESLTALKFERSYSL